MRRGRGRPSGISDAELLSNRDMLAGLLENSWGEIGVQLPQLKTATDVRTAFQGWAHYQDIQDRHIVRALLRPSDCPSSVKELRAIRRARFRLVESLIAAREEQQRCRARCELIERAARASPDMSEADQRYVTTERANRDAALLKVEEQYLSLDNQRKTIEQELMDSEAYFARAEVLRFVDSQRYTVSPQGAANALAGLPMIGYRRSALRWHSLQLSVGEEGDPQSDLPCKVESYASDEEIRILPGTAPIREFTRFAQDEQQPGIVGEHDKH